MRIKLLLALVIVSILAFGCVKVVCKAPYIQVGKECCLDQDDNKICDKDEVKEEESKIVIREKVPETVEKEVKVKEYVCTDGSVVMDTADCPIEESESIPEDIEIPELDTNNELRTVIENVTVKPACVSGVNGGRIYFKVGSVPYNYEIEMKEVGNKYETVYKAQGLFNGQIYFAICDSCQNSQSSFELKPDTAYITRLKFNQSRLYGEIQYSNEHLIDTREDSDFMTKICS